MVAADNTAALVGGGAERDFFGEVIGKKGEKEEREAQPFSGCEPCLVKREFEPGCEQENENQAGEKGSEQS